MNPLVSVIIPFHNNPTYQLKRCLDSLINQNYDNYEIIAVNNNSTESYDEIYNLYCDKVIFVSEDIPGVSNARNKGLNIAKGEYVLFCDADDFVEVHYISTMVSQRDEADIVICGIAEQWFPVDNVTINQQIFCSFPSRFNYLQYVNFPVNKLFKMEVIREKQLKFNSEIKLGEDALFVTEYLKSCHKIKCISSPLYHYVYNEGSSLRRFHEQYLEWEIRVIRAQMDLFNTYELSKKEEMFLQKWLYEKINGILNYYYLRSYEKTEEKFLSLQRFLRSLSLDWALIRNNIYMRKNEKINFSLMERSPWSIYVFVKQIFRRLK